jgi:glycosyltransferase involved in cell wall biosynthesis
MSRKKIAIVTNSMKGGGTEKFVSYLLENIKDKYETHLLLTESKLEYELPENQIVAYLNKDHDKIRTRTSIWEFPLFLLKIPVYAKRLINYCRKNDIDLIVSFLGRANHTASFAKILGFKGRVLIGERTHVPSAYSDGLRGKIALGMAKILYPYADGITINSIGGKEALKNVCKIENDYFLLKNVIDVEEVRKKSAEPVESEIFDKFVFVYVAGFREGKNHAMLIEAFAKLNNPNTNLLLIGKGRTMDEAVALTEKSGVSGRVFFEGHTNNPYKYLAKADCFVSSSDFEGFPNVLLEALACNLPIIATDCESGPRELLAYRDNYDDILKNEFEVCEHGILTPVGNVDLLASAMKRIVEDEDLRKSFKEKANKRAMDFSVEGMMENFCEIVEK